jgi:hypothetical protein
MASPELNAILRRLARNRARDAFRGAGAGAHVGARRSAPSREGTLVVDNQNNQPRRI